MKPMRRLTKVELPIAMPVNYSYCYGSNYGGTLAALIGAVF